MKRGVERKPGGGVRAKREDPPGLYSHCRKEGREKKNKDGKLKILSSFFFQGEISSPSFFFSNPHFFLLRQTVSLDEKKKFSLSPSSSCDYDAPLRKNLSAFYGWE
jgi:hypothetical protein